MEARLTGQRVALGLVLVPLAVEVQRAALAVGQLAAHLLIAHGTVGEVFHILCGKKQRSERKHEVKKKKKHQEIEHLKQNLVSKTEFV